MLCWFFFFFSCVQALQRLIEMGFEEAESVEALRMFRNDQDAAVSTACYKIKIHQGVKKHAYFNQTIFSLQGRPPHLWCVLFLFFIKQWTDK